MKRISPLERIGLRVYAMPRVDKKFLKIRKSFDQVNQMVKEIPGGKTGKKQ